MIFRNANDYTETQANIKIQTYLQSVKLFAQKLAPAKKDQIDIIEQNLSVIVMYDRGGKYKYKYYGHLEEMGMNGARGHFFWDNVDTEQFLPNGGIAVYDSITPHTLVHESLHAFSSESGRTANKGYYFKSGSHIQEFDNNASTNLGKDLNEAITDALASRFFGNIGPDPENRGGYGSQVIMADLLIGEQIENNFFIQDVYFGKSQEFSKEFDKVINSSNVKFADYLQGFRVLGSETDNTKSDMLLKTAIEYNLKKAKTPTEIDNVYAFQQKIINFYKNGGIITGFMEQEDIERLDNLLKFANTTYKTCKLKLANPKSMSPAPHIINYGRK